MYPKARCLFRFLISIVSHVHSEMNIDFDQAKYRLEGSSPMKYRILLWRAQQSRGCD